MKTFIICLLLIITAVPSWCAADNCTEYVNCQDCEEAACFWVRYLNLTERCQTEPTASAPKINCTSPDVTTTPTPTEAPSTSPPETTTTTEPTTEVPTTTDGPTTTDTPTTDTPTTDTPPTTNTTTTDTPTPTTTVSPTESPNATTTEAPTTTSETPTTDIPSTSTQPSTTVPSSTPSPCTGHHFDAGSFFGGIFLAVGVLVVSYAGLRFYRARNGRNYNQLQETVHM